MSHFDSIVKGGTVFTACDSYVADIGIKDGRISAIGINLGDDAKETVNAFDRYVIPGGIDPHTHFDMPFMGTRSSDDFETGGIAAACGGTTTIVDFANQWRDGMSLRETVEEWHKKASEKCPVDYGFHVVIAHPSDTVMQEIPEMIRNGYTSLKLFMTYEGLMATDDVLLEALIKASEGGGLVAVHAENFHIINYYTKRFIAEGKVEPQYHALSRPPIAEGEATGRAIKLARLAGAPIYMVHVSCRESVEEIDRARSEGITAMGETCPQYLLLSYENYLEPGFAGAKYVMSPPLRDKESQPFLWKALKEDVLQVVSTDHCPFFMKQKEMGKESFVKIPNGAPGVELRMALLYTYGVCAGKFDMNRYVQLTSTNAAKIFGIYPKKGAIAVGSDADLVILDPNEEKTIERSMLHENVDYTPYEGFAVKGYPEAVMLRGKILAKGGAFVGSKSGGSFIKRNSPIFILR